jgi:hypothetical protein
MRLNKGGNPNPGLRSASTLCQSEENCNYFAFRQSIKSKVFSCENARFYPCFLSVLFCFSGVSLGESCLLLVVGCFCRVLAVDCQVSLLLVVVCASCLSGVGRCRLSLTFQLSVLSSEIHSPYLGDKVNSGIGSSYRAASLCSLTCRYDNTMPKSTLYPRLGK